MKNYLRISLVSILSVLFLASCCKFSSKKTCSANCSKSKSKKEETLNKDGKNTEASALENKSTEDKANEAKKAKKVKKVKKAKKVETATQPNATQTNEETKNIKN